MHWRQKFIGLLPEVHKRKLYEKKGFQSIFEFAKKLAGLSEEQTRTALNLDRILEDKPVLKNIFINGEVSINKLVGIMAVAKQENQEEILDVHNKNDLQKSFLSDHELHVQPTNSQKTIDGNFTKIYSLRELQQKGTDSMHFVHKS